MGRDHDVGVEELAWLKGSFLAQNRKFSEEVHGWLHIDDGFKSVVLLSCI